MDIDEARFKLYDRLYTQIIDWINDYDLNQIDGTRMAFQVVSDLVINLEDDLNESQKLDQ